MGWVSFVVGLHVPVISLMVGSCSVSLSSRVFSSGLGRTPEILEAVPVRENPDTPRCCVGTSTMVVVRSLERPSDFV